MEPSPEILRFEVVKRGPSTTTPVTDKVEVAANDQENVVDMIMGLSRSIVKEKESSTKKSETAEFPVETPQSGEVSVTHPPLMEDTVPKSLDFGRDAMRGA